MKYINENGFEVRDNNPEPEPVAPPLTERKRLEQHLVAKYGQISEIQKQALDLDFPEPRQSFGEVGQGQRGPRSSGDPLEIRDFADFLARKDEIFKAAYPDTNN